MLHVKFPLPPKETAKEGRAVMSSLMPEGTIPGRGHLFLGKFSGAHNLKSKEIKGTKYEEKREKRKVLSSQKCGALDTAHLSLLILFEK